MVIPPPKPVAVTEKVFSVSIPQASPLVPVALPINLMAFAVVLAEVMLILL